MNKRRGAHAISFEHPPSVTCYASVVGKKEGEGPLSKSFDLVSADEKFGEETWERAESALQQRTIDRLLQKAKLQQEEIDYLFGGDLLNQCIATAYGVCSYQIPFYGLYGACSTMAEGTILSAKLVDGGYAKRCIAIASSHFCSAERQYRLPLVYGGQRSQTAQWTATGAGAVLVEEEGGGPYIVGSYTGKIVDMGITDVQNMGAGMAPAALDTFQGYFRDTGTKPADYDLFLTGDLGQVGFDVVSDLMKQDGFDLGDCYQDCGMLLYDRKKQDVHAGGSGCGCSAIVLCGEILGKLKAGIYHNVLFVGTGALMSPTAMQQGRSIMGIGHLVHLSNQKRGVGAL